MDPLPSEFESFVRKQHLIGVGEKVLLAVSGGRDSMAMVRLFLDAGIRIGIAHVDHGLRDKESTGDADFVKKTAERFKLPFHELKADTRKYCRTHRLSIQEGARELRYKWLDKTAGEYGYDRIATAHHLDDSIETFFIQLLRGTGIHGLCGIPVRNGRIIRPLLFAPGKEIDRFVRKKRLKYREDSSNLKDDYLRNRIRHHLIPMLAKLQPSFIKVMEGNIDRLRLARELFDAQLETLRKKNVRPSVGGKEIALQPILESTAPGQLLHELLRLEGFNAHEPEKLLLTDRPGKRFRSDGKEIVRDRNRIILQQAPPTTSATLAIHAETRQVSTPAGRLYLGRQTYRSGSERKLSLGQLMLDADTISYPIEIRPWKGGDRFRPLGMKNQKKVSDFLTDRKLSLVAKERTWVAVSAGRIICILGHRISEEVKVTSGTRKVLLLRWLASAK